jgi:uncharacterized protein YodC (DUF2158 family)
MAKARPQSFKPGDIVQLKSGGPKMTVKKREDYPLDGEYYSCQWFAGSKLSSGSFDVESLVPVENGDGEKSQ